MIEINYLNVFNDCNLFEFRGEKYLHIEVNAYLDGDKEKEHTLRFVPESLGDILIDAETGIGKDRECEYIDNAIYGYIPDYLFDEDELVIAEFIEKCFD